MREATRKEMIEWLHSDDGGEGLPLEFLNDQTDKYLRRVCHLAGTTFTNWLAKSRKNEANK